jgi:hypothetical protein
MSTELEPKGEPLRKAVRWISDRRRDDPEADIRNLVNEAGFRFDLGPLDQEFLWNALVRGDARFAGAAR